MLTKIIQPFCFVTILFLSSTCPAQTVQHVIDYTSSPLPTTLCNVFNVSSPYSIGGYTHFPVSGGVTFDATNLVLATDYAVSPTSSNLGTAYAIRFPFKKGNTYAFQFNAKGTDGSGGNTNFPYVNVSLFSQLPDPNKTDPIDCGPVGQDKWSSLTQSILGGFYTTKNTASYTIASYTATSSATQYLIILAYGGSTSSNTALISKITISETAPVPAPSFTLSQDITSISCGSITPVKFTVNNNGVPNITDYTWNLGANNGWLINGSPAPQTISTGTTNTLTLTPEYGSPSIKLTATVTFGSNTFTTSESEVTVTPAYSFITGSSAICPDASPANYSIDLPFNSTVAWTSSIDGIVTIGSPTSAQTTLTGIAPGKTRLTATITGSCPSNASTLVTVTSLPVGFGLSQNIPACQGGVVTPCYFTAVPAPNESFQGYTFYWGFTSNGVYHSIGGSGSSIAPKFTIGSYELSVSASNACGETDAVTSDFNIFRCSSYSASSVQISPNPAINNIKIQEVDSATSIPVAETNITAVEIVNKMGITSYRKQFVKGIANNIIIPVGQLTNDIYTIRIFDGKKWIAHQILVQH